MERIFRMLQNSFEIQTRNTHKKAVSLITDSLQKLEAGSTAALVAIYTAFLPFFNAYISLNDAVGLLEGTYKGKTNLFESLIDDVSLKLREWEGKIRSEFPEDSPTEIEIFPNKRKPFYEGTYEQRLGAIRILRDKLLEYTVAFPSLVPVQADVAAYYTLCEAARSTQQGKEGNLGELRIQRETQRVLTMQAYMGLVYGGLLKIFYADLKQVGSFIDFPLLYDLVNEDLLVGIDTGGPGIVLNVPLDGVAVSGSKKFRFIVKDEGADAELQAYFTQGPTLIPMPGQLTAPLHKGDNKIIEANDLGFGGAKIYLNIFQVSGAPAQVQVYEVA